MLLFKGYKTRRLNINYTPNNPATAYGTSTLVTAQLLNQGTKKIIQVKSHVDSFMAIRLLTYKQMKKEISYPAISSYSLHLVPFFIFLQFIFLVDWRLAASNADGDRLVLEVGVECLLTQLAANTRLLVAAKGNLGVEEVVVVDPDGTSVELVADADGSVEILGVDGRGQAVGRVVAHAEDILLVLELGNGSDGSEDLLAHNLHVVADVTEDGGLDEVTLGAFSLSTNLELGTLGLASVDVAHDTVELELADLGSLEGLGVGWVADLVLQDALLEGGNELVVDALLDIDTGTSRAGLGLVVEHAIVDP